MAQAFNLTARINMAGPYNLRPIISKIKKDISGIKPELKFKLDPAAAKSVKAVTAEIKKLDAAAKNAKKSVGSLNSQLMSLSASFNAAATASKNAANATNAATRATANAAKTTNQARTAIEEFGKQSGLAIKRFAAFSSVTSVIFGVTNAITDAYKEFLSFNKELVRLSQVTNKSVADLQGISDEITRLSTTLGVTSTDLITVASTLAQAGLSAQDTSIALEALAKSALAPSFENIADTTEGAIAAIRQFGLETRELDSALGSINAVAAAFAVEAGDIIAAIQRTGGVFASASRGVSEGTDALNEFIAIFTSVRQTTRESAETIATGLRTIFTRIQRSSTIDLLKQYGIQLRDLEGKFVGPFEAVKRLSEGLSSIDPRSADFAKISEELGGFRQIGKVIPLIQQFAVAQDALNVAQAGSDSLTKDVIAAQQSLAIQFEKTRQNFLALVREIGDSTSFKVFVNSTLVLTNALIDLGRILKPLLPLLLTFGAIKAGSGLTQFASGFGLAFNRGNGGGGPTSGGPTSPTGGGGGGGNQPLTSALTLNTTATNALVQSINTLNTNILSLNQTISNRPSPPGFASGGLVPGSGNRDTVSARLTPGEFVIRKRAVEAIGAENLAKMNNGGIVQKFQQGGISKKLQKKIVQSGSYEDYINENMIDPYNLGLNSKIYNFGLVGLRSGTKSTANRAENRKLESGRRVRINVGFLQSQNDPNFSKNIENDINNSLQKIILKTASSFGKSIKGNINPQTKQQILDGAVLSSAAGSVFESALQMIGAPYIDKIESLKSMDFPFGLGDSSKLFGDFPSNVPTDATRTIAGSGKGISDFLGQINRFFTAIDSGKLTKELEPLPTPQAISAKQMADVLVATIRGDIRKQSEINSILKEDGIPGVVAKQKEKRTSDLASRLARSPKTMDKLVAAGFGSLRKAAGGDISGKDTVPALLTPGEFVFNKESAQRIGYTNLNRMNKVQGFNKGGIVGPQKFALGGAVASDPAAIVAALTGILIPQIQRLSETFGKLQGDIGNFGTALGGIVRETSSIVLSAGIGLRAVGASEAVTRRAQIGGGIAAGIGGGITDVSTKLLNKALQENTKAISVFEKSLQDYANAPTEELKIEAAKKVEQNFLSLDTTIRNTKDNIDRLENIKNFGETINNATLTVLTTITAMTALAAASKQASLAVAASKAPGAFVTGAAAVSTGTKLLAGFGRLIPIVGGLISVLSIGVELFSFFSSKLKSTDDQFERLNGALRETINISNDYNLANENFINNILPQFRTLQQQQPGQQTDISRQIGSLTENSLNLTRNFLIKQFARSRGLSIGSTENIQDVRARISGQSNLENILKSSIEDANKKYIKEGFVAAMKERGVTDPTAIASEAEKLGGFDAKAVIQIAQDYFGELDRRLLAERNLTQASSELKVNMINLTNTVNNLESIFNRSLSNLEINFKNLNRNIDILVEDIKVQSSTVLDKNIQILENLKQSTPAEISRALSSIRPSLGPIFDRDLPFNVNANITPEDMRSLRAQGIEPRLSDQTEAFAQISDAIQANAVLQQRTDIVLNKIAQLGLQGEGTKELLNQELKDILISSLGGAPGAETTATTLINELASAIQKGGTEGKPITSFQEASSRIEGFGTLISELENTTKSFTSILKIRQQAEQQVIDSINRELELRSKFTELSVQRQQTEVRNNISLKRILGQRVSLEEINEEFLSKIRILTRGIPGVNLTGGQITAPEVNIIAKELAAVRAEITRRETEDIQAGRSTAETSIILKPLIEKSNNLSRALQEVANAGVLVSNTFEEISKDKDLLKSQEQLLFELIRDSGDPVKALELDRIIQAVQAVENRRATFAQAQLAVEKGVGLVTAARGPEMGEIFGRQAMIMFREQAARFARTPEEVLAAQKVLNYLTEAADNLRKSAKTPVEAERAAQEAMLDPAAQAIMASMTNTTKIFNNFNNEIATAFASLLQRLRDIENRVQSQVRIQETTQIPENIANSIVGAINSLTKAGNVNLPFGPGGKSLSYTRPAVLSEARAAETLSKINTGSIKETRDALEALRIDISRSKNTLFGPDTTTKESRANQTLGPVIRLLNQLENQLRQPINSTSPSSQPRLNQGSFLDPSSRRSLDTFNTSSQQLATALTGENNSITRLSDAVNSLTPVINTFKTAAEALASKIGPEGTITINQTAKSNVNVTFDEPLQVDIPTDNRANNNELANNIITFVQNQISALRRDLGA